LLLVYDVILKTPLVDVARTIFSIHHNETAAFILDWIKYQEPKILCIDKFSEFLTHQYYASRLGLSPLIVNE